MSWPITPTAASVLAYPRSWLAGGTVATQLLQLAERASLLRTPTTVDSAADGTLVPCEYQLVLPAGYSQLQLGLYLAVSAGNITAHQLDLDLPVGASVIYGTLSPDGTPSLLYNDTGTELQVPVATSCTSDASGATYNSTAYCTLVRLADVTP